MNIQKAKQIMSKNFIGPDELNRISEKINLAPISERDISEISYKEESLEKIKNDYLLIFGSAKNKNGENLTINNMRSFFGFDPAVKEPCLYNQDWYLKEEFAAKNCLRNKWYLIKKELIAEAGGKNPDEIEHKLGESEIFPSAILTVYAFFAYYFHTQGEVLWPYDFIWCSDRDSNGDRIYTGRYYDSNKINKNGFNIHRYLTVKPWYGAITQII